MDNIIVIGFIFILIIFIYYFQERKRKKLVELFTKNFPKIQNGNREIEKHLEFKNGYFRNYQMAMWKNEFRYPFEEINNKSYRNIGLNKEIVKEIECFFRYFIHSSQIRNSYNSNFISYELNEFKDFFDNIEGHSLDEQQRRAIVTDEDNNLVVAGAGSGKTTTIAGKVAYLIKRYKVDPKEILLISFTNRACDEMRNRIRDKMGIRIDVKTFHKFGLDIMAEVKNEKPSIFGLSQKEVLQVIDSLFKALLKDSQFLTKVTEFFPYYLKPYKSDFEFHNKGEKIQYLKDHNICGYKRVRKIFGDVTYEYRESLKSQEEVDIANFLLFNGIEYEYERSYEYSTATKEYRQYKPDFYLPEYGIYIEHFAIDKNGDVPHWFKGDEKQIAKQKYHNSMLWKRNLHKKNKTRLIETYSWERMEEILLRNLKEKLEREGVRVKPKSPEEIWQIIQDADKDEIVNFTQLLQTFLALFKSNNYSLNDIRKKINKIENKLERERDSAFFEIFIPVYERYELLLKYRNEIDFNDMINKASGYVNSGKCKLGIKYIIIDEFQDTSIGRFKLIKALLDKNPECKLFCVGDDWQSIFRFTGSDISIFTEFDKYFRSTSIPFFERATQLLKIETTYRFGSNLIEISSGFILKNPKQIKKELRTSKIRRSKPFTAYYYEYDNNKSQMPLHPVERVLNDILMRASSKFNTKMPRILLLGRYHHDIQALGRYPDKFLLQYDKDSEYYRIIYKEKPELDIRFLTVHSAKGLEADYVIIINCESGKFGFPCELSDDPILNLLLTEADQFPNGEERRLFYVAITRTKEHLYFIVDKLKMSKFFIEIESKERKNEMNCPWCETGILTMKTGKRGDFQGCSNYPYCRYTRDFSTNNL